MTDYEGFVEQVCLLLLSKPGANKAEHASEVVEFLSRCRSLDQATPGKPLRLVSDMAALYLGRASAEQKQYVKTKANLVESLPALHAYLHKLMSSRPPKVDAAQTLINLGLQVHYRDSTLWHLLAQTYEV